MTSITEARPNTAPIFTSNAPQLTPVASIPNGHRCANIQGFVAHQAGQDH